MNINDLLIRKKYLNINNILHFVYKINIDEISLNEIRDNNIATLYYIFIQLKLNKIIINKLCLQYVYDYNEKIDVNYQKKLLNKRNNILSKFKLNLELLNFPLDKTKKRLNEYLKLVTSGYHTYGDYENVLSYYLSAFFSYEKFIEMLEISSDLIRYKKPIDNLKTFLINELKYYFIELEKMINNNQIKSPNTP